LIVGNVGVPSKENIPLIYLMFDVSKDMEAGVKMSDERRLSHSLLQYQNLCIKNLLSDKKSGLLSCK